MTRAPFVYLGCAALLCLLGACSTRYSDVIVAADDPVPVPRDRCADLNAEQCALDLAGCTLQPNPTGCVSSDPTCGVGKCAGGDPYVRPVGGALSLHNEPFVFIGTVSWGIAWADNGCKVSAYASQEEALAEIFDDLATMHVSVLRFWAFQSFAGPSGTDFSHFDRLRDKARSAGVRLIPVLENMHSDCSSGTRDDAWFGGGYLRPYGNYALSYQTYVERLVTHFSNEPTIMAWELMHEASGTQFAPLEAFTADMASLVRRLDQNHLLALGLDVPSPATSLSGDPSYYFRLQDRPEINLVDVHDFDAPNEAMPANSAQSASIAHALGKPVFIGAAAVKVSDASPASLTLRAGQIERKLSSALAANFRGFLVYDFVPSWSRQSRRAASAWPAEESMSRCMT